MKSKQNMFWGYFLVVLGTIMLLSNWFPVGMEVMWPIFPLLIGISLIYGFINNKSNFGLLMPGTILIITALLFFYCNFAGWHRMEALWPFFLLAPAIGFAVMYVLGEQETALLIPAVLFTCLGIIFLFISSGHGSWWPIIMILGGVFLIVYPRRTKQLK